jgi:tryptophan-rich sensory protein
MRAKTLAITALGSLATAILGGLASDPGGPAYSALRKPSWQPPGAVFGPVWTALYADIAGSTAVALDRLDGSARTRLWVAWATNLGLNAAWPAVFFSARRLWPAAALAGVLAISSADLARRVGAASPAAGGGVASPWRRTPAGARSPPRCPRTSRGATHLPDR